VGFLIVVYEEHEESIQKAEACWSINNTEQSCSEMPGSGNGCDGRLSGRPVSGRGVLK
jgi:hypothetical protein